MRMAVCIILILLAPNKAHSESLSKDAMLYDALLARVGREAVLWSDLIRFHEVEKIMICAGLRAAPAKQKDSTPEILDRYVEEELIYQEARIKKMPAGTMIADAVSMIRGKEECKHAWQELGKKFSALWATKERALEGESILVVELEKRLFTDRFLKTDAIHDRNLWIREAKVKTQVKLYLD